jgi:hypothetical protein
MTTPEDDDVARNQPKGSHQRGILYRSTPQSVPACTCSKHPLWDGYDGDCPIHGWFEPVAPDTPQSVPAWELVPCMDAWCKISPCKCRDGINALIAERDRLFQKLGAMTVERDKLKAENEGLRRLRELDAEEYAYLTEIEAERDSLRDALATLRQDGDMLK